MILLLGALIVALHLGTALAGRPAYRALHLGPALNYARGSINLFRPVVVGFTANEAPMAQEFPLWHAVVGLVFKVTHSTWFGWANLVSLLMFALGLWPFFQLASQYTNERAAWWSLAFLLAQPLIIFQAGNGGMDGLSLTLMLWFLYCADKMLRTARAGWWAGAAVFGILSAVSKVPFFMAAGLCGFFLLLLDRRDWRAWVQLASVGVLATMAFFLWSHHTDSLAAEAEYPYVDVRFSHSPYCVQWFFGDWHSRLAIGSWIKGGWRFLHVMLGSLPLAALLIIALFRPGNSMPKLWLAGTAVTTLLFSNLVLIHTHYYLMCSPAVAMLCGATVARWEDFGAREIPNAVLRLALAAMVLVFSAVDGLMAMKVVNDYDTFARDVGKVINEHTSPEDKLIIYGEGQWGGEVLIPAQRKGLSVFSLEHRADMPTVKALRELLDSDSDVRRLKELGFNKVVLLSESPVRFAVTAVNPGSKRTRILYPQNISPKVDAWPVVYRSEDVLIKEIP